MATHDITCREFVEVVTDLLESQLPVAERDLVERHLAMCTWCQTYTDQMRRASRRSLGCARTRWRPSSCVR